jgi:hypothetical protein
MIEGATMMGERAPVALTVANRPRRQPRSGSSFFDFLESEVVLMDIQITIELFALVISAIGLGIYIERKK